MSTSPIDLSGGFVPKPQNPAPQAAPSAAAPIDLSGGFVPKPDPTLMSQVGTQALNFGKGIAEGAGQTVNSISRVLNKIPGIGETLAPTAGVNAATQLETAGSTGEKVGQTAESIGEFFAGDEALKGLSLGEKAMKAADLAERYEKATPFAKAVIESVMNTVRAGAVSDVQSLAHGATAGEAAVSGLTAGAVGVAGDLAAKGAGAAADYAANKLLSHPAVLDMFHAAMKDISEYAPTKYAGEAATDLEEMRPSQQASALTDMTKAAAQAAEDGKGAMPNMTKSLADNKAYWSQLTPNAVWHMAKVGGKAGVVGAVGYTLFRPEMAIIPDWMKYSILTTVATGLGYSEVGHLKTPEVQRAAMLTGKGAEAAIGAGTRVAQSATAPAVNAVVNPQAAAAEPDAGNEAAGPQ